MSFKQGKDDTWWKLGPTQRHEDIRMVITWVNIKSSFLFISYISKRDNWLFKVKITIMFIMGIIPYITVKKICISAWIPGVEKWKYIHCCKAVWDYLKTDCRYVIFPLFFLSWFWINQIFYVFPLFFLGYIIFYCSFSSSPKIKICMPDLIKFNLNY